MKNKIIIISMLLLACLPSLHAGRSSSNIGAAALGAAAGMFLGAAIAGNSHNHCTHTCSHTEYVHVPQYNNCYTERVEVCRPVVETRRVYTQPTRVVTHHYSRPQRCTEVYYKRACAPVYNEYYYAY